MRRAFLSQKKKIFLAKITARHLWSIMFPNLLCFSFIKLLTEGNGFPCVYWNESLCHVYTLYLPRWNYQKGNLCWLTRGYLLWTWTTEYHRKLFTFVGSLWKQIRIRAFLNRVVISFTVVIFSTVVRARQSGVRMVFTIFNDINFKRKHIKFK